MCGILAHMASIDPFKYDVLSDEEKSAYICLPLTIYDSTKLKIKKNRKYENCRADRSIDPFPRFQACD